MLNTTSWYHNVRNKNLISIFLKNTATNILAQYLQTDLNNR
jgi:hypothetical protein